MKRIVKRHGITEDYNQKKLYASIYSACIAVRVPDAEADIVASHVLKHVENWLADKSEVTSHDIHQITSIYFSALNPDAAYLYKHHDSIS